jgi:chromosomal replication initiator protein
MTESASNGIEDPAAVWSEVLSLAAREMNESTFRTWLSDSAFESLDSEHSRFLVRFPNEFMADWAKSHFGELLDSLFRSITSRPDLALVFIGDPASPPSHRPPPSQRMNHNRHSYLHPSYTFDRFVAGSSNELAYAGAMAVSHELGSPSYNPLFIYGGVGLGKTHLIQAIAHYLMNNYPQKTFKYISSEQFTQRFISAMSNGPPAVNSFRREFMDLDLLLMDDIQFMAGKERTQEELFHRFNDLYQLGGQIVFTSDRPPNEIEPLEERLISRFESGLVVDIQPPEFETRLAILQLKARTEGQNFPSEVLSYIASTIKSNVRQLEGAIHRLAATCRLTGSPVDMEMAERVVSEYLGNRKRALNPGSITSAVAEEFSVSPTQLKGKGRKREILVPRQIAMYLIRELTSSSLASIGEFFSGRDHSTVLNAINRVEYLCDSDSALRRRVEELRNRLTS